MKRRIPGFAFLVIPILIVTVACRTTNSIRNSEVSWQTVDEGFRFKIPADWKKMEVQGTDSHCGRYRGKTAFLEFDEVTGLGWTADKSRSKTAEFTAKEKDPPLLNRGEQIWRLNGRVASFTAEKADSETYGKREFTNVARLFIPYEGEPAYLNVLVFFRNESDLPVVRRILESIEWRSAQRH
jgi:hypothetical protein